MAQGTNVAAMLPYLSVYMGHATGTNGSQSCS
jgi:hypothetical protein